MEISFAELKEKEVVNISDGKKLIRTVEQVNDTAIDFNVSRITAICIQIKRLVHIQRTVVYDQLSVFRKAYTFQNPKTY